MRSGQCAMPAAIPPIVLASALALACQAAAPVNSKTFAIPSPASDITLSTDGVVVQLDTHLPRPVRVTYHGVDLSPPADKGAQPEPAPSPTPLQWWKDVKGQQLIPAGGPGCTLPTCRMLELPKGTPNTQGASTCAANCSATTICVGWNMIRVTPTSGQRNKGPLCMFYHREGLRSTPPFYHADGNFECGTKEQLQHNPPQPSQPSEDGHLPQSRPCISIIAANGSATRCCGEDMSVKYNATMQSSTNWTLQVRSSTLSMSISGSISVGAAVAPSGVSELRWQLFKVRSSSIEVKAIDIEFALIGHRGGRTYLTHQQKTWCPPGTGCEEWRGAAVSCAIGEPCSRAARERQVPTGRTREQWQPPQPLPPAFKALLKPGRAAFVGAADGKVGYSGFSSQPTLPFQAFGWGADGDGDVNQAYGAGPGRLQISLRCGNVLPVTLKFGLFEDITADSVVGMDDAVVFAREQYPLADSIYRAGLVMKLDSDITSYTQNENMARITFNETLGFIQNISALVDNATVVLHLVGWQSSGHDTGYPSYDQINPNLGTEKDLWRLAAQAKAYNTVLSFHINVDEAYKNLTATAGTNFSWHPVPGTDDGKPNPDYVRDIIASTPNGSDWLWGAGGAGVHSDPYQGGAYHISKTKDAVSGRRWERLQRFLKAAPVETTVHSDAYRDINDSWETDERGFIAEDEEAICGLQADKRFWASHGISFGVEGSNGCLCAIGPVPGFAGITDYYWHGGQSLGTWNRIIGGTAQGLDKDICAGPSSFAQPFDFQALGTKVYMQALVYAVQMTDQLLSNGQFLGGGNQTHWPFGGSFIEYRQNDAVFLPAVLPPTPGAPKTAPTTLSADRLRVFSSSGGVLRWTLPRAWVGKHISSHTITPHGSIDGPRLIVTGENLVLHGVPAALPVILSVAQDASYGNVNE